MKAHERLAIYTIFMSIILLLVPSALLADPSRDEASGTRAYTRPEWSPGDWWRYEVHAEEQTSIILSGISINIDEMDEVTTQVVQGSENVVVNGSSYEVYNSTLEIQMVQSGTWSYMGMDGDFFDESTSKGYIYHRTSDLAMVKKLLDVDGKYVIPGLLNSPYQGRSVSTSTPPLDIFRFPMTPPNTWTVNSIVVTDVVVVQEGEETRETIVETHNYLNTVTLEESGTAAGVNVDYYPVHQVGTITIPGNTFPVNGYVNYSAQVKNSIDGLTGFGGIEQQHSDEVDLKISLSDVSVSPEELRDGDTARVTMNIENLGRDPAVGVKIALSIAELDHINETSLTFIMGGCKIEIVMDLDALPGGEHMMEISLDPDDSIQEENEANNIVTKTIDVAVNHPPAIHSFEPFSEILINKGTSLRFSVNASDADGDAFIYSWTLNGVTIAGKEDAVFERDFTEDNEGDVITIGVTITDVPGANTTKTWNVTINSAPVINATHPAEREVSISEGEEVRFHIRFSDPGEPYVVFKWYRNGVFLPDVKSAYYTVKTATSGPNSSKDSPMEITAIVEDVLGLTDEFTWTLIINDLAEPPEIIYAGAGNRLWDSPVINETDFIRFNVSAIDPNGDVMEYTWFVDGREIENAGSTEFIFTTDWNTVDHTLHGDARLLKIMVLVEDGYLNASHNWSLEVRDVNHPVSDIHIVPMADSLDGISEDDVTQFTAEAMDMDGDTIEFRWYLDGERLAGNRSFNCTFLAGNRSMKLVMRDGHGSEVVKYVNFTVLPGQESQGSSGEPDNKGGNLGKLVFILVGIVVIIAAGLVVFLILRRNRKGVRFTSSQDKLGPDGDEIFLCPRCNEKADKELGYCMECGHSYSR